MKKADISILITNYNHSEFLIECLDAVFSQSVLPKEVIVIDDASTDHSIALIREYQRKRSDLILLQNPTNQGPAKTMNTAIAHASSKYVVLAAADDQVLPGFFEESSQYLDLHPEIGICCSEPSFFEDIKPYSFSSMKICHAKEPSVFSSEQIQKQYLHGPLWIPTHASLYRRDLLLKYGCLQDSLKHLCDWYLNCKIAALHGIAYIPRSFGAFRVSRNSYSASWNRSYQKKITLYKELFLLLAKEPPAFQKIFCKSGMLGLISSDVLFYGLLRPYLWKYLPFAFYRKTRNFLRKVARGIKSLKPN
jgi:glycosyltransferase involved in cell wall biosynthesis